MAGIVYTYNRGSLTFGGQTHDINQSWVNNLPTRVVQVGDKPIWPSFTVGCVDGTLNFTAGKGGGMQGDFTITNSEYLQGTAGKIFPGDIYQIDPAGGNGTVNIKTSESSYWHQLSLKVHFEQSSFQYYQEKVDGKAKITNIEILAESGTTEFNVTSDDTSKFTYIRYNVLLNSNINSDGKILTALSNEEEHNQNYMPISVKDYEKNGDAKIGWSIGPNNNIQSSYTKLVVDGFYDLLGNYYPISEDTDKPVLFSVFQNPNVLYYVHLAFCQSVPSDYGAPTPVDSIETDYNATNTKFYVFVELGKSSDGGNNIYWNDPNHESDITKQINDITKELTLKINNDNSLLNYTVSVDGFVMNGNKRTNYVECTLTNNANDESNNKSGMTQQYLIKNKSFINYKYINSNFYKDPLYGALLEASEVKDSTIEEKFQIYRTTATQSVSVTIEAELHSGNYNL